MRKTEREITQSWILRILPEVNPSPIWSTALCNATDIFCRLREVNALKIYWLLVIYTLDAICDPNIMAIAQAVLGIVCSQACIGLYEKNIKGRQFSHGFRAFYQKLIRLSTPRIQPVNQI